MSAGWLNSSSISFSPQDSDKRYHSLSLIEEGQKSMEIFGERVYSFLKLESGLSGIDSFVESKRSCMGLGKMTW